MSALGGKRTLADDGVALAGEDVLCVEQFLQEIDKTSTMRTLTPDEIEDDGNEKDDPRRRLSWWAGGP